MASSYFVAISALLFSGFSALTLINAVRHLDSPAPPLPPEAVVAPGNPAVVSTSAV